MSVQLHLLGHSPGFAATNACDVNDGGSCDGGGVDLRDRGPDAAPAPTHSGKVGERFAVDGACPRTAAPGKVSVSTSPELGVDRISWLLRGGCVL